jgi:serine phosphatase RsbU (regulator of sigma subunit)
LRLVAAIAAADEPERNTMQLLVVKPRGGVLSEIGPRLLDELGWQLTTADDYETAIELSGGGAVDAVILAMAGEPFAHEHSGLPQLIRHLQAQRIATLVLTDTPGDMRDDGASLIAMVSPQITDAELRGRLATIQHYRGMLRRLESELENMERLGKQLDRHFRELDEEMRLAGRLQRDFLPKLDGSAGDFKVAAIFRPAGWVSGDMYDVMSVDDDHLAIYVADAVGHGVAAGLLTMFIKQAITPTRIEAGKCHVLTPSEVMAGLNDALVVQDLPQCQFVTACYALLDRRHARLACARGGHPYPLLIRGGGEVVELETGGGLLGIGPDGAFPAAETELRAGDKVIFYTDGVELGFGDGENKLDAGHAFQQIVGSLAAQPLSEMFDRLAERLDAGCGSLAPGDDVTIVGLEWTRP